MNVCPAIHTLIYRIAIVCAFIEGGGGGIGVALRRPKRLIERRASWMNRGRETSRRMVKLSPIHYSHLPFFPSPPWNYSWIKLGFVVRRGKWRPFLRPLFLPWLVIAFPHGNCNRPDCFFPEPPMNECREMRLAPDCRAVSFDCKASKAEAASPPSSQNRSLCSIRGLSNARVRRGQGIAHDLLLVWQQLRYELMYVLFILILISGMALFLKHVLSGAKFFLRDCTQHVPAARRGPSATILLCVVHEKMFYFLKTQHNGNSIQIQFKFYEHQDVMSII